MVKKRKSSLSGKGLTFKKGRELVIRVKTLEGKVTEEDLIS